MIEHVWIPMRDGCRLAARIWLPEDANAKPVPAILEYTPYRKNDATALSDAPMHAYFAGCGYASVRVDLRGSGDSEGVLKDEYLPLELEDGVEVIGWLADQDWCTGAVGMIGISWGGFNALQIAARAPTAVHAVVSVASSVDRYGHDVHYMGGCVLASTMLSWASTMLAYNARPPDPQVVGEAWRDMWIERMQRTPPYIEVWLSHQTRDAYWQHGSICEDYSAINCPVYMVGGWSDPYRDAVLSFLANYPGPCKGLIGPWAHRYPHDALPGPAIGFLQEAVRWWDQWLKGAENGIMDEPPLHLWLQDSVRPGDGYPERAGRWISETRRPSGIAPWRLALGTRSTLSPAEHQQHTEERLTVSGPDAAPVDLGAWCSPGSSFDCAPDQRPLDGVSLLFDTEPLPEPREIVGTPSLRLQFSSNRANALLVARLCDVWPDGASTLITRGLLNLSHRAGHERPELLVPGQCYTADIELGAIAHAVPAGHRLRLALAPEYWPWAWPSPETATLTIVTSASVLVLPVRTAEDDPVRAPNFAPPTAAPQLRHEPIPGPPSARRIIWDAAERSATVVNEFANWPAVRLTDAEIEYQESCVDRYQIVEGEPLSALTTSERRIEITRANWHTKITTTSTLSATRDAFLLSNVLNAYEADTRVYTRAWSSSIPRCQV